MESWKIFVDAQTTQQNQAEEKKPLVFNMTTPRGGNTQQAVGTYTEVRSPRGVSQHYAFNISEQASSSAVEDKRVESNARLRPSSSTAQEATPPALQVPDVCIRCMSHHWGMCEAGRSDGRDPKQTTGAEHQFNKDALAFAPAAQHEALLAQVRLREEAVIAAKRAEVIEQERKAVAAHDAAMRGEHPIMHTERFVPANPGIPWNAQDAVTYNMTTRSRTVTNTMQMQNLSYLVGQGSQSHVVQKYEIPREVKREEVCKSCHLHPCECALVRQMREAAEASAAEPRKVVSSLSMPACKLCGLEHSLLQPCGSAWTSPRTADSPLSSSWSNVRPGSMRTNRGRSCRESSNA